MMVLAAFHKARASSGVLRTSTRTTIYHDFRPLILLWTLPLVGLNPSHGNHAPLGLVERGSGDRLDR